MTIDDLQIVIIDNIKSHWDNKDVRELYCQMMNLKFKGYGHVYGQNVVSADTADFFGTHLIVCKKGLRLEPIFGYKSVTLNRCEEYLFPFSAESLMAHGADSICHQEINKIISNARKQGKNISFDYSWVQDPAIKNVRSPEMVQLFRDLAMVLGVNHHQDYCIDEMITCGVVRVKTDLFFEKMGLSKISKNSLFNKIGLNGDPVHIFHTANYSKYAVEVAAKYKNFWDQRIEFLDATEQVSKILKVA